MKFITSGITTGGAVAPYIGQVPPRCELPEILKIQRSFLTKIKAKIIIYSST